MSLSAPWAAAFLVFLAATVALPAPVVAPCHHESNPTGCLARLPPVLKEFQAGPTWVGPLAAIDGAMDEHGRIVARPGAQGVLWFAVYRIEGLEAGEVEMRISVATNGTGVVYEPSRDRTFVFNTTSDEPHVEPFEFVVSPAAAGDVRLWFTVETPQEDVTSSVEFVARPAPTEPRSIGGDDVATSWIGGIAVVLAAAGAGLVLGKRFLKQ